MGILPKEPVECLDGHIDEKLKWKQIQLRDTIAADGTMGLPLSEYIRHLRHSEERADVDKQTTVNYHPEAEFRDTQVTTIDFVTGSDLMQDNTFKSNVRRSLNLRGYKTGNSTLPPDVANQVALLRKRLIIGLVLQKTRSALKIDEGARPTRYANPGECIPCHLHAKNREGEKMFKELLLAGMQHLGSGKLSAYVTQVEELVNRKILNRSLIHEGEEGQWRFPLDEATKKLKEVNLSNPVTQKMIAGFEILFPMCLARYEDSVKDKWIEVMKDYREMHAKLGARTKFMFDEVCSYQLLADKFLANYNHLTGRDGMTNYMHLHKARHWAYFLLWYGNVHKYSQQGYENINGVMKRDFHTKTQKGGGRGGTSKLLPNLGKTRTWSSVEVWIRREFV